MPEYFEQDAAQSLAQRYFGGWRVVIAAWALAIAVVLLFTGVQALASRHAVAPLQQERLVGAMIPSHERSCVGPADLGIAPSPNCRSVTDDMAKAEAEAEVGASYGW